MKPAIKYGILTPAAAVAGWALRPLIEARSEWMVWAAVGFVCVALAWCAFWAVRDLLRLLSGERDDGDRRPPAFIWTWQLRRDGSAPFARLIPMDQVIAIAYKRIRHRIEFQVLQRVSQYDQTKLPSIIAGLLTNGHPELRLYGRMPPFPTTEEIPAEDVATFHFSEDARELRCSYNEDRKYVGLAVRRSDLERRLRQLDTRDG